MNKRLSLTVLCILLASLAAFASAAHAAPLKNVTAVAAGDAHTCAIADKQLYCWGRNYGQLGDGTVTQSTRPVRVVNLGRGVRHIATAEDGTCASTATALKCWGDINGKKPYSTTPTEIRGVSNPASSISIGQGLAWNWDAPMEVCAIARSALSCGSLDASHRLFRVTGINAASASTTGGPTCVVDDGAAKCWGDGQSGKLGNGSYADVSTPTAVTGLSSGVTAITSGPEHACAIVNSAAKCWGKRWGVAMDVTVPEASYKTNVPFDIPTLGADVSAISAGENFTCAIVRGAVKCWGRNWSGELGSRVVERTDTPIQVPGLTSGATAIAAGRGHACAIVKQKLKCWGFNANGQLGHGGRATANPQSPVTVTTPARTVTVTPKRQSKAYPDVDYKGPVEVSVAYAIPAHVKTKHACGARLTITLSAAGNPTRTVRTRFLLRSGECWATWHFAEPIGRPESVTVKMRSAGDKLLKPFRGTFDRPFCFGSGC